MIAQAIDRAAARNLIGTYFTLGSATQGAKLISEPGFRACVGPLEHPICNFAADLSLSTHSAGRLQDLAISRPSFNVYELPGDEPQNVSSMLSELGFQKGHQLRIMVADPANCASANELILAESASERRQVAAFMAEQFFSRQDARFRRRVEETTSAASTLSLYKFVEKGKIIAASMISDESGLFGIYNLCVASACRGCGWGSEMLRAILSLGARYGKGLTLQCEPGLEVWYAERQFRSVGSVQIHSLPKSYALDIMEQS